MKELELNQILTAASIKTKKTPVNRNICPECQGNTWILRDVLDANYSQTPFQMAFPCPKCGKTGKQRYTAGESEQMQIKSDIPARFRGCYLENIDWTAWGEDVSRQKAIITDFIENFKKWKEEPSGLYLYSKTKGSGKTYISAIIGNELLRKGCKVRFMPETDILRLVKDKDQANRGDLTTWERIRACELLIIDDFGAKKSGGDWHSDEVKNLIDYRYANSRVTILTSNIELSKLDCDERVLSRLYESEIEVKFPEISIRTQQAKEQKKDFLREVLSRQGVGA